jgi:hypothetical protein
MAAETRARLRVGVPFVLAAACLIVAGWTSAAVTAVLLVVAFALVLDGATLVFSKSGRLGEYRQ